MSEKEKKEIAEMVETAKHLAANDPQAFMIAKSNMEILKIRADMDNQGYCTTNFQHRIGVIFVPIFA